jgi:hypothetical protein
MNEVYTSERCANFMTLIGVKLLLGLLALIVLAGCSTTFEPPATQSTKLKGAGQQPAE